MKVLLIRPHTPRTAIGTRGGDVKTLEGMEIDLGLPYIASYLETQGREVEILDLSLYSEPFEILKNKLKIYKPDIVGITANTPHIFNARSVALITKRLTNAFTVIGGIHASSLPIRTLEEFSMFDFLVEGEGEMTFQDLLTNLESENDISKVKGIAFRDNDQIRLNPPREPIKNIDELPFPARHKLEIYKYVPPVGNYYYLPSTGLISSRGCPYACTFCSRGGTRLSRKVRFRSPENVIEEIEDCIKRFGIRDFRFYDDVLTIPRSRIEKLCELIIEKKLDIKWNCYSRVDHVDENLLKTMKHAGCYHIKYGVEVGTGKALKIINKGTTLEQAKKAIKYTKKVGIEAKASFMLGIPGETIEDTKETIKFAKLLSPDYATFTILTPLPGSKIFDDALENNMLFHTKWDLYSEMEPILRNQADFQILKKLLENANREFYFRPSYILQRIKRLSKNLNKHEVKNILEGIRALL